MSNAFDDIIWSIELDFGLCFLIKRVEWYRGLVRVCQKKALFKSNRAFLLLVVLLRDHEVSIFGVLLVFHDQIVSAVSSTAQVDQFF